MSPYLACTHQRISKLTSMKLGVVPTMWDSIQHTTQPGRLSAVRFTLVARQEGGDGFREVEMSRLDYHHLARMRPAASGEGSVELVAACAEHIKAHVKAARLRASLMQRRRAAAATRAPWRSSSQGPSCAGEVTAQACGGRRRHLLSARLKRTREREREREKEGGGIIHHNSGCHIRKSRDFLMWHPLNYTGEANAAASHEEPAQPPTGRRTR